MTDNEIWKMVPGFSNYSVSNLGRVRNNKFGRILTNSFPGNGYPQVKLYQDGSSISKCVHHLVAFAFLGPRPIGHEVNHKNAIRDDNHLYNLEYIPWDENRLFPYPSRGPRDNPSEYLKNNPKSNNPNALDTKRIRLELGLTQQELAVELGMTIAVVSRWETGKSKPSRKAMKALKKLEEKVEEEL